MISYKTYDFLDWYNEHAYYSKQQVFLQYQLQTGEIGAEEYGWTSLNLLNEAAETYAEHIDAARKEDQGYTD